MLLVDHLTSTCSFTNILPIILTFLIPLQRGFHWDARSLYLTGLFLAPLCTIIHTPVYLQLTLHVAQCWSSYKTFVQSNMLRPPSHHDILKDDDWTHCRGCYKHILMTYLRLITTILSRCIPHTDTVTIILSSATFVDWYSLLRYLLLWKGVFFYLALPILRQMPFQHITQNHEARQTRPPHRNATAPTPHLHHISTFRVAYLSVPPFLHHHATSTELSQPQVSLWLSTAYLFA